MSLGRCTEREVCRHFGLHRSTFGYRPKVVSPWLLKLKATVERTSRAHAELGYAKITRLLQADGWKVGTRLVQRIRRELGLRLMPKGKRQRRRGPSTGLPTVATHRGHVWSWDFVHDTTMKGGSLRMLNVIDEHTRECLCIHVERRLNAAKVRSVMQRLVHEYGAPQFIRSDNGSEFIEKDLRHWLKSKRIDTLYIEPGSPWQNGYIESFNARLREECLNRELLYTLTEARVVIEDWRWKYNNIRPHRSLGYITPRTFAEQQILKTEQDNLTEQCIGSFRAMPSLRRSIDFLYNKKHTTHAAKLTKALAQFV